MSICTFSFLTPRVLEYLRRSVVVVTPAGPFVQVKTIVPLAVLVLTHARRDTEFVSYSLLSSVRSLRTSYKLSIYILSRDRDTTSRVLECWKVLNPFRRVVLYRISCFRASPLRHRCSVFLPNRMDSAPDPSAYRIDVSKVSGDEQN